MVVDGRIENDENENTQISPPPRKKKKIEDSEEPEVSTAAMRYSSYVRCFNINNCINFHFFNSVVTNSLVLPFAANALPGSK
jgi:hypothetical protein